MDCEQLDGNVSASVPLVRNDIDCAEPLRLIATTYITGLMAVPNGTTFVFHYIYP